MKIDRGPWIQTYTGKRFHMLDPQPEEIDIIDIAHALSMMCRFTGHTSRHYSVAEHSMIVAAIVDVDVYLDALLHDASEAYLCDIARPIKHHGSFDFYRAVEKNVQDVILKKFRRHEEPLAVKNADRLVLGVEAITLLNAIDHPDWNRYTVPARNSELFSSIEYLIRTGGKSPKQTKKNFLSDFSFFDRAERNGVIKCN